MKRTLFDIPKMDCPSEEQTIRLALGDESNVKKMNFDLSKRQLEVLHQNTSEEVLSILVPLGFGASISDSSELDEIEELLATSSAKSDAEETSVLRKVFVINAVMFFVGLVAGIVAESTGLLADSLDMFADATVFGLSLYAVGRSQFLKKRAARISGFLQMALAIGALSEVVRRFYYGSEPEAPVMMIIASVALVANATCMFLLAKHRKGEVHMQASWIFLSNDVVANIGVIIAGVLVKFTNSQIPDLVIGAIIAAVVLSGSIRILKATK
jgi:Co/Zn/Cd efflux system component